jgi:hypothetical protein
MSHGRFKFAIASLLKRLRDGRFTSETAVRRFQKRNGHLDPRSGLKNPLGLLESSRHKSFLRRRRQAWL